MLENNCISDNKISVSSFTINTQDALCDLGCSDKYQIVYFTHGCGKYIVEGIEYKAREHTALVIKPFSYTLVGCERDCLSGVAILFSQGELVEQADKILREMLSEDEHSKLYTSFAVPELVISVFEKLELVENIDVDVRDVYLNALLCEAVSLLSISSGEPTEYNQDELGARVARYLNRNIDKNISLDKLAGRFFVSKYYLCRAFKKYSGTSVHSYINRKRILYAKQLIDAGETASVVAYKVGYGDYSAFYRAYKNIIGKSPVRN